MKTKKISFEYTYVNNTDYKAMGLSSICSFGIGTATLFKIDDYASLVFSCVLFSIGIIVGYYAYKGYKKQGVDNIQKTQMTFHNVKDWEVKEIK